jgi:MerR family copper efflux transcriptional regulator
MASMKYLKIGQVAKEAEVNIDTVRYYERRGLLPSPKRKESGYRQYLGDTVNRIRFIKHAQELGFSLDEIAELLSLKLDPVAACSDVKKKAEGKIAEIDGKIEMLGKMREALKCLVEMCAENRRVSECPILEALDKRKGGMIMNVDCYMSQGCGSEDDLRLNISRALAIEKVEAKVDFHRIDDAKAAVLGLTGSPSVFIDGTELQPQGTVGFS